MWWLVLRREGRAGRGWGARVRAASSPRDFCAVPLPSLGPVSSTSGRTAASAALSAPGLMSQEPSASPVLVEQFGRVCVTESEAPCCVFTHHSFSLPQRGPSVRWASVCCLPGVHRGADLRGDPGGQGGAEGEVVAAQRRWLSIPEWGRQLLGHSPLWLSSHQIPFSERPGLISLLCALVLWALWAKRGGGVKPGRPWGSLLLTHCRLASVPKSEQ